MDADFKHSGLGDRRRTDWLQVQEKGCGVLWSGLTLQQLLLQVNGPGFSFNWVEI